MARSRRSTPACPTCSGKNEAPAVRRAEGGAWYCDRCEAYLSELHEKLEHTPLNRAVFDVAHKTLLASPERLEWLYEERGLSPSVVKKYRLGLEGADYLIPIPDAKGNWINCKRAAAGGKLRSLAGVKGGHLFPPIVTGSHVIITEGEWDCMLAESMGFEAHTNTAGASTWRPSWSKKFIACDEVYVVYDTDEAGRDASRQVAESLLDAGLPSDRLKVVRLPLPGTKGLKDLSDWVLKEGAGKRDVEKLIKKTPFYNTGGEQKVPRPAKPPQKTLREAGLAKDGCTWSTFPLIVQSISPKPAQLPTEVQIKCTRDWGKACARCGVPRLYSQVGPHDNPTAQLDTEDPDFVALMGQSKDEVRAYICNDREVRAPAKCPMLDITYKKSVNAFRALVVDTLTPSAEEPATEALAVFLRGDNVMPGTSYQVVALTAPSSKTQERTHFVFEFDALESQLENFKEDSKLTKVLSKRMKLSTQVERLVEDAHRITDNVELEDLHLAVLLTLHTPLWIRLADRLERGWGDIAVIGNTNRGKTTTANRILQHVGLGSYHDVSAAGTRAGLLGGSVKIDKGEMGIVWGVLPLNDRKIVLLDEAHSKHVVDVIPLLTGARSNGKAQLSLAARAGATKEAHARTRIIWLANAGEGSTSLERFAHPIQAVKQIFVAEKDIRRLDFAILVGGDSPVKIDLQAREKPKILTRDVLRNSVLRAWTLPPVDLPLKVIKAAQANREFFASKYTDTIPLLDAGDGHWKLARYAVALSNLVCKPVDETHVEYIAQWLDGLYESDAYGFLSLSKELALGNDIDTDRAEYALRMAVNPNKPEDLVIIARYFLNTDAFATPDFKSISFEGGDGLQANLMLARCIERKGNRWVKTNGFTEHLRRIIAQGAAPAPRRESFA